MDEKLKKEIEEFVFSLCYPIRGPRPVWRWANNEEGGYWTYE